MSKKDKDLEFARMQLESIEGILKDTRDIVRDIDRKLETTQQVEDIIIFSTFYDQMCEELGVDDIETMGIS